MAASEPEWASPEAPAALGCARSAVVGLLGPSPTAVDDLIRRCQLSPATVMAALLELELAGRVESLSGHRVALTGLPGP
jgi:DNA processing protein